MEKRKMKWKIRKENLRPRTVNLWASASMDGSRPDPQTARRRRLTKKWNVLSVYRRAFWTCSR